MTKSKIPVVPEAAVSGVVPSPKWAEKVKNFAETCDLQAADVEAKFTTLVGKPSDKAASRLGSDQLTPFDEIVALFPDVPKAVLREAVAGLRDVQAAATPTEIATVVGPSQGFGALPALPDDDSFIAQLVTGGKAKMPALDAVAAVRAHFANTMGLFGLLDRIADGIEKHALSTDEQVPEIFEEIDLARARRRYPEELRAMGVTTRLVTKGRKDELFRRMEDVWPALREFQNELENWMRSYTEKFSGPAALASFASKVAGGPGMGLGMNMPDSGPVRDAAAAVIDVFNKAFAGTGIQVSRGLAFEAAEENKYISRTDLHVHMGFSSRDQMLKELGVAVGERVERQERATAQFVWCVMKTREILDPDMPSYIEKLCELGRNVPWDRFPARRSNGASRPLPSQGNKSFQ